MAYRTPANRYDNLFTTCMERCVNEVGVGEHLLDRVLRGTSNAVVVLGAGVAYQDQLTSCDVVTLRGRDAQVLQTNSHFDW